MVLKGISHADHKTRVGLTAFAKLLGALLDGTLQIFNPICFEEAGSGGELGLLGALTWLQQLE